MIYFRHQVRLFVILFDGRSGSSYLTELLESQPGVRADVEILARLKNAGADAAAQMDWVRQVLSRPRLGKFNLRGFKTKLRDVIALEEFAALVRRQEPSIVHLRRRNQVKAVVSALRASQLNRSTGGWNLYQTSDRQQPMDLDVGQVSALLKLRAERDRELEGFVNELQLPTVHVTYEDLLTAPTATMTRVGQALGFRYQVKPVKILKHTSDDLRRDVTNIDELKRAYAGTPYADMFDEVLLAD